MKKKSNSKKVLSALLVTLIILTNLSTPFAQGTNTTVDTYELLSDLKQINTSIERDNVDVIYQLQIMKNEMISRLSETDDDELISQIKSEVEHYTNLINWYNANPLDQVINEYENSVSSSPMSISPMTNNPIDAVRAGVVAMIAGGKAMGFDLAAELLAHSLYAQTDSTYRTTTRVPDIIRSATGTRMRTFATNHLDRFGDSGSSSDSFPNGSTTVEKDLYLAVHAFRYSFYGSSNSNVIEFKISDYYDFDSSAEYTSLVGAMVNYADLAHGLGIMKY